jgi:hypothetical protein
VVLVFRPQLQLPDWADAGPATAKDAATTSAASAPTIATFVRVNRDVPEYLGLAVRSASLRRIDLIMSGVSSVSLGVEALPVVRSASDAPSIRRAPGNVEMSKLTPAEFAGLRRSSRPTGIAP